MALSMEEQRILAEIEQRLTSSEPVLAAQLSTFTPPRPVSFLRSPRFRVLASCIALVVVTVVSLLVYALLPLRATTDRGGGSRPTGAPRHPTLTVPHQPNLGVLHQPTLGVLHQPTLGSPGETLAPAPR
jgi:hypothetical protein